MCTHGIGTASVSNQDSDELTETSQVFFVAPLSKHICGKMLHTSVVNDCLSAAAPGIIDTWLGTNSAGPSTCTSGYKQHTCERDMLGFLFFYHRKIHAHHVYWYQKI
jgi:hypothetical protein